MGRQKKQKIERQNFNELLNELNRKSRTNWISSSSEYKANQSVPDDPEYRVKLIRKAAPTETKNLELYEKFFAKAGISTRFMIELIEKRSAFLELINENAMKLQVGEDTWIVELMTGNRCCLLHNNYLKTLEGGRVFQSGYHKQNILVNSTPEEAIRTAMDYKFDAHRK